ncbi:MAG: AAA family ATPase [Streptosporangiaceae bacterium]
MPSLILLNGPPAAGKSTLAQRYADEHPLTLNLDIDRIRGMLGQWRGNLPQSGLLARKVAIAAASVHLAGGHDVVVPQLVARLAFIEQLEVAARDCAARFCEVFLLGDRASLQARYRERARVAGAAVGKDPAVSADRTDAELAQTYDELLAVIDARPAMAVIQAREGDIEQAYRDLLASLGSQDRS